MPATAKVPRSVHAVNDLFPIVTRLKHRVWTEFLLEAGVLDKFQEVPKGLQYGFHIGLEQFQLDRTFTPPNHFTTPEHTSFVRQKCTSEIALGRISKGYLPEELFALIGHFRSAPLSVAESKPGKLRVITNHSFPRSATPLDLSSLPRVPNSDTMYLNPETTSINTVIDSTKFQCAWGSFSECFLLVTDAPPGTQAAVFDVESAFRNIPTHPSVRNFTTILLDGLIHLDGCLNFGASPSPGLWGQVADAMVQILLHKGVEALIKWVDDFIFLRYPKHNADGSTFFSYDESLIWSVAEQLGWPWAPEQFIPFAFMFLYISFLWDLEHKTVELPEAKKEKYKDKIAGWLANPKHSKDDAENIIGTLNHVTLVVPEGRSYMVALYKFRATFKSHAKHFTKHTISQDLISNGGIPNYPIRLSAHISFVSQISSTSASSSTPPQVGE